MGFKAHIFNFDHAVAEFKIYKSCRHGNQGDGKIHVLNHDLYLVEKKSRNSY